jgi:hypothetical protein
MLKQEISTVDDVEDYDQDKDVQGIARWSRSLENGH